MCPPRPAPGCGVVPWSAAWLVGLALCVSPPVHSGALSGCWGVCCYCPVRLPRSGPPPGVSLPATPGPAASRRFPVSPAGAWPAVARRRGAAIFGTDVLSLPIINASGSRRRHGTHLYLPAPPRASTISGDGGQIGPPVHQSAAARAGGRVLSSGPFAGDWRAIEPWHRRRTPPGPGRSPSRATGGRGCSARARSPPFSGPFSALFPPLSLVSLPRGSSRHTACLSGVPAARAAVPALRHPRIPRPSRELGGGRLAAPRWFGRRAARPRHRHERICGSAFPPLPIASPPRPLAPGPDPAHGPSVPARER